MSGLIGTFGASLASTALFSAIYIFLSKSIKVSFKDRNGHWYSHHSLDSTLFVGSLLVEWHDTGTTTSLPQLFCVISSRYYCWSWISLLVSGGMEVGNLVFGNERSRSLGLCCRLCLPITPTASL